MPIAESASSPVGMRASPRKARSNRLPARFSQQNRDPRAGFEPEGRVRIPPDAPLLFVRLRTCEREGFRARGVTPSGCPWVPTPGLASEEVRSEPTHPGAPDALLRAVGL